MRRKILTIIIPAYNVEFLLNKCLDSLISNACAEWLDIIVVNDGSKDATMCVGQEYERRYPGIVSCIDKENGGHGSAINSAYVRAEGKYLKVLDADDTFLPGSIEKILPVLSSCESDIILTPFYTVDVATGKRRNYPLHGATSGKEYSMCDIETELPVSAVWFTFHGIFFKTDYYKNLNLHITEHISYDDTEYVVIGSACAKTVTIDGTYVYLYTVGSETQSVAPGNYAKKEQHLRKVMDTLLAFAQKEKGNQRVALSYLRQRIAMLLGTCEKVLLLYCEDKSYGRKTCRALRQRIVKEYPSLLAQGRLRHGLLLAVNYMGVSAHLVEKIHHFVVDRIKR
ncbi:MAG: glycosyltransferase family 2 protein [Clostridium sp.]|nr:glycosyltransferase family 2 protein [Clostridium sp.]